MQAKTIIIKRLFIFYSFLIWSGKDTEIFFTKSTVSFVFQGWELILSKKSSSSKSLRLLLHFGKVVGLDEVLDELFQFFGFEAKECDDVETVFLSDGAVVLVVLEETANLVRFFSEVVLMMVLICLIFVIAL